MVQEYSETCCTSPEANFGATKKLLTYYEMACQDLSFEHKQALLGVEEHKPALISRCVQDCLKLMKKGANDRSWHAIS